ncbi:hypothetical protein JCM19237_6714 [Photobacterium aphoticum]|uniref:Uncharacterized protein n=1 Tax=Photobacterium aphoticum TaxID=754436 RepID=A0A090QKZ1_9GAMM|nr:hypothetical protein JCM19237_6714 [Photobacterium aphoticum]
MCFDEDLLTPPPLSPKGYLTFAGLMKTQPETCWQRNGDLYLWHALRDGIGYRAVPKDSTEIRALSLESLNVSLANQLTLVVMLLFLIM